MVWLTESEKTLGLTEICASRVVINETLKQIHKMLNCNANYKLSNNYDYEEHKLIDN